MTPATNATLDLYDERLLPVDAFPVPEPDTHWALKINDYNEHADHSWDGDFMTQVTRDGDEYYDISALNEENLLRVSSAEGPVIFGLNTITSDAIEVVELDEETARYYIEIGAHQGGSDETDDQSTDDPDALEMPSSSDDNTDDSDTTTESGSSSSSSPSRNDRKLPVTGDIGDMDMRGMLSGRAFDEEGNPLDDPSDAPLTGFQLIYTTGSSLLVPRDELLARMADLGLPEWMAPPKVKPYAAFGRMCSDLIGDEIEEYTDLGKNKRGEHEMAKYDIPKNDGDSRDRTLDVKKYVQDPDSGEGEWKDHLEIARFWYDSEVQDVRFDLKDDAEGTYFEDEWETTIKPTIERLFEMHQRHHNGRDINTKVMNKLVKQWTESVRIRDAVYFVPAIYGNVGDHDDTESLLRAFVEFYEWLDAEYKHEGKKTRLHAIPIYNTEEEQRMVTESVVDELEAQIESFFDNIRDELTDDDFTDEVIAEINDEYQEMENVAERYSQIVDGRLSVEQLLNERLTEVEAQEQRKIRQTIDDLDELPSITAD